MLAYVDKTRQDTFICAIDKYHLVTVKQLSLATWVLFDVFKIMQYDIIGMYMYYNRKAT